MITEPITFGGSAIVNNGILNWNSTHISQLGNITNNGAIILDPAAGALSLSGSSSVNEAATYTLTIGSVSGYVTDTITAYLVDWGDGSGLESFASNGNKTHIYPGSSDSTNA